jgi:hypothetical protein
VKKGLNHGLNGLKDDTDYSPPEKSGAIKSVQSINPCKSVIQTGYKQTEVGVIPEEWDFGEIGNLNPFVTSGSRGWAQYYSAPLQVMELLNILTEITKNVL